MPINKQLGLPNNNPQGPPDNPVFYEFGTDFRPAKFVAFNTLESTQEIGLQTQPVITDNPGNVTYVAGTSIHLKPGFKVKEGCYFHAYINELHCNEYAGGAKNTTVSDYPDNMHIPFYDSLISAQKTPYDLKVDEDTGMSNYVKLECPVDTLRFKGINGDTIDELHTYYWDFGNGTTSTEVDPKVFYEPGTYNFTLILTDTNGVSDTMKVVLEVPDCRGTLCGTLTESPACGSAPLPYDTIYLVDTNDNIVQNITAAVTDSNGYFCFYDRELKALDSTALFGFKSGKGYVIEDTTLRTIPEWFALSPLQLNITDIPKPEWTRQYFGASDPLNLVAKTIDINENIHVLGAQYYNISNTDLLLLKYNSDGDLQWVRTYASPGNISDNPVNLCTDSLCNIYIIGNKGVYSYNVDFLVLKYDSSGTQQWMRQYNAGKSPTSQDYVTDLVTDNHGNLYVSGYSIEQNALVNLVTIKYNALGRQQWVRTFFSGDYSQNPGIYNADLSVDNLGNTYLAGSCIDVPGNNTKYLIIKRNPAGDVLWTVKKDINLSGPDNATGMALDKAGNIFVTGNSGTVKYDNDGNFIWHQPGNFNKILVDNSDNIYVGNIGPADFLKKYDNITGNVLWSLNENPVYDFFVDRNNNIYFGSTDNCWKADSAGNIVASITFPYQAVSACISPNLNLYVAGYEPQNDSNYASYSIYMSKYSQCPSLAPLRTMLSVSPEDDRQIKVEEKHFMIVPNPNNGEMWLISKTLIDFGTYISIYDLTGREAYRKQINEMSDRVQISTSGLDNGIYLYTVISAQGKMLAKDKLVIIK